METDCTIILRDGRILGYAEYGEPHGQPVVYLSGGNSSRMEAGWFDQTAKNSGVRLVAPDRPGFGLSSFQPARRLLDWPDDVAQLADELGLGRFGVFGLSGGGPHVASVAHNLPDRVTRAAIVSGAPPPEMPDRYAGMWLPVRIIFLLARFVPPLNRVVLKQMSGFYANEQNFAKRFRQTFPAPDVALAEARPEVLTIYSAAAQEAHRHGVDGDAWEWSLYVRPWGFELEDISVEVGLWYGAMDRQAPANIGRYLDRRIPNSHLKVVPDGGHFSTINNYVGDILGFLVGDD